MVDWQEVWNSPASWAAFSACNAGLTAYHAIEGRSALVGVNSSLTGFGMSMTALKADIIPSRDEAVTGVRSAWHDALGGYFDLRHAEAVEEYVEDVLVEEAHRLPDSTDRADAIDAGAAAVREAFIDAPLDYDLAAMDEVVTGAFDHLAYEARSLERASSISLDTFNDTAPAYTIGKPEAPGKELDPGWVEDLALQELVDYCWLEADSRADKIEFVEDLMAGRDAGLEEWLAEADPLDQSRDYYDRIRDEMTETEAVETAAVEDLITSAMGLAMNKDDAYKETLDEFKHFFHRYDPSVYAEVFDTGNTYTIDLLDDVPEAKTMLKASGSCIRERDTYAEEYMEDDYTLFFGLRKNRKPLGYMRAFVMEDGDDDSFLAVDTMEIDHKHFEENSDVVKACGLAAIQTGIELGHAYVAGTDARIRFGPRQAYSSTERSIDYHKYGPSVQDYVFRTGDPYDEEGYWSNSAYLLVENPLHFTADATTA